MYDRSAIMKDAWARFRHIRAEYAPWQIARGIVDGSFATALRTAWRIAKEAAIKAVATASLFAALEGPNGDRIVSLQNQIERLRYADNHFLAEQRRIVLQAELMKLAS